MFKENSLHRESNRSFNIPINETMGLQQYINSLTLEYDDDEVIQLARQFCLVTTNEVNLRVGMQFLYINGFFSDVPILIDKNAHSQNKINQQWAKIFELTMVRRNRSQCYHKITDKIQAIKASDVETEFLLKINLLSLYFDTYQYGYLSDMMEELQSLLIQIDNPALLSLFTLSLDHFTFLHYWKRNEVILARKYGFRLLNQLYSTKQKAHLHINLSLTYIFDDFDSSLYHLLEARKISRAFNDKRVVDMIDNQNYPFICAHFGYIDKVTAVADISEQAHLEIAKGNLKKAQALLAGITEVTPFTKYYLGRAHQDRNLLISSYNDFIEKRSDHFFARLPLQALQKL